MTRNAKILIVDDEPFVLDATARILRAAGYTIYTAATGAEGLRLARAEQPDLILLDVILPDESGLDICRTLKADDACRGLMVLLTSAHQTSSDSQAAGLECGADGYIARPVSNRELLARIQVLLRTKQAEDALRRYQERLEDMVASRTAELRQLNGQLQTEMTVREQAVQQAKLNESRLNALLILNQKCGMSLPEIADYILDESIALTQSEVGFLGFLTPDERVCGIHAWSEAAMRECRVKDRSLDFVIAETGIWGECVRQRAPFALNAYTQPHALKRGMPDGHLPVTRFLAVPLFEHGRVAAVLAVANKTAFYDDADIRQLTLLGDGMIRLLQKRRVQQELRAAKDAAEKANQQLQQQQRQIQEQNAELREVIGKKDKFFAIVAHDIKNPLASFVSFVNLFSMKSGQCDPAEMAHLMEALRGNVDNLSALLDNLLTWARMEQGRLEVSPQTFDVEMLAARNIALLAEMAAQKQITLRNRVEKNIIVYADVNTLDTVVRNLLTNALKFTMPGGEVILSATRETNQMTVSVTDTGVGMSPDTLESIFRIDVQHHKVGTAGEKGTGLGLTLCKEFVEKNGGALRAESREGQGSTFSFTVPSAR